MSDVPYSLEQDLLQRLTVAQQHIQQGAQTDAATAANFVSIARTWPDITPGAAYASAKAGFTANSPEVRTVAQVSTANNLRQTQGAKALASMKKWEKSSGPLGGIGKQALNLAGEASTAIGPLSHLASGSGLPGISDVGNAVQAGVRTVGLAANTPLQYIQGQIRGAAQDVSDIAHGDLSPLNPFSAQQTYRHGEQVAQQTQAGQAVAQIERGQPVQIGAGYLPDPNSPTGIAAAQAARNAAPTIAGHAFTIGRYAAQVFEPHSEAYKILSGLVDATVAIKTDPTASLLGAAGDERAAGRIFAPETAEATGTAAGLVPTMSTAYTDQTRKVDWLNGTQFTSKFAEPAAATTSPSEIIRMGGMKNGQWNLPVVDVHGTNLAAQLGDANTPQAVRDAINQTTQIVGKFDLPGVAYKVKQSTLGDSRLFAMMANPVLDSTDKNQMFHTLDLWMRGGNVPLPARNTVLDQMIRARPGMETEHAIEAALEAVQPGLRYTMADRKYATMYDLDQATRAERVRDGAVVDGQNNVLNPSPTLTSEGLHSLVVLPNPREVRQLTSSLAPITGSTPYHVADTLVSALTTGWKGIQIATARLPLRIFLDSQLNLAAHGYASLFNHPVDYLSAVIGTSLDKKWAQFLAKVPGVHPSFMFGPDGRTVLDGISNNILGSVSRGGISPGEVTLHGFVGVPRSHPLAAQGLTEELGRMHLDPIMRQVATSGNSEDVANWLLHGEGNQYLEAKRSYYDTVNEKNLAGIADGSYPADAQAVLADLHTPQGVRSWLDSNYYARLRDTTGGNQELLDAVANGTLGGKNIWRWSQAGGMDATIVTDTARQRSQDLLDQGYGPANQIKVRHTLTVTPAQKQAARAIRDHIWQTVMDHLMTLPDRDWNRNPAMAQSMWRETEKYLPYADDGELAKLNAQAVASNLPRRVMDRLSNVTMDTTSSRRLTADQITQLAKADATTNFSNLVHDLHGKSQFGDMARVISPFGDAFRKIAQRWANTIVEQPQTLRRFQQGLQAARDPGSGVISQTLGDPVLPGQGFFHADPTTGEEVFTIPGTTFLDKSLIGVPLPLTGKVAGLSLVGSGYPGIGGPAITLPAKWFLPDTPGTANDLKNIIFPNGGAGSEGVGTDIAQSLMPAWLNKIVDGAPNTATFNNTVADMLRYLASTGKYELTGPNAAAETQRLAEDAKSDARWAYVIRGAVQFTSPASPAFEPVVNDKSGHLQIMAVLAKAYQAQKTAHGPDAAMNWLLTNLGPNNIFLAQAGSQPVAYSVPITKEGTDWTLAHPQVRTNYPTTYGLFAPQGGKFDITAYEAQFTTGERKTLSAEQQVAQAENRVGLYAYYQKQQTMLQQNVDAGGTPTLTKAQQSWLSDYKTYLTGQFPGFGTFNANPYDSSKKRNDAIAQLTKAASDKSLAGTDAQAGLKQYLQFRDSAMKAAPQYGVKTPFTSVSTQPLRAWLRGAAAQIIKDHPDFAPMWEQVFSGELKYDVTSQRGAA